MHCLPPFSFPLFCFEKRVFFLFFAPLRGLSVLFDNQRGNGPGGYGRTLAKHKNPPVNQLRCHPVSTGFGGHRAFVSYALTPQFEPPRCHLHLGTPTPRAFIYRRLFAVYEAAWRSCTGRFSAGARHTSPIRSRRRLPALSVRGLDSYTPRYMYHPARRSRTGCGWQRKKQPL